VKASNFHRNRWVAAVWVVGLVGISWIGAARVDAATIHVSAAGNDANDGLTWPTAKRTVQAGLNAAVSGDQVWVAAGTYVENITLTLGVGLYGGFAGGETDLSQRNWTSNPTILDGNHAESTVTTLRDAGPNTRIDGFVIRNGGDKILDGMTRGGGGIYCLYYSCPTIANNTIVGNMPTLAGGGIFCDSHASPTITNNAITGNTANNSGGGIYCYSNCSPMIANNRITGNASCGIYCRLSSPTIVNNTIAGNIGTPAAGIYSDPSSSPTIVNTIVAFNSAGICKDSGTGTPTFRNNCVFGNTAYSYSGVTDPTGTAGNISLDPRLADLRYGNVHVRQDSPCVDAGDDSVIQPDWTDMDGQDRKNGSHVDIGADESDGTVWPAGPNVIVRVSPAGNDANNGSSWALAKRTVQEGIDTAAAAGGELWVAAGTYVERITLRNFAHLYGGFAGTETQRHARNWSANTAILDGALGGSVVTADRLGRDLSTIDGFTIRNGTGTRQWVTGPPSGYAYFGGGIYCTGPFSPRIVNNRVSGNTATYGGGIGCKSAPTILNNTITGNTATYGGGIYSQGESSYMVGHTGRLLARGITANNVVAGNTAASYGGGIYCFGSMFVYSHKVVNNIVAGNSAGTAGGGIYCEESSSAQIASNTITDNAATQGGGICLGSGNVPGPALANSAIIFLPSPVVTNTIIAFNSSGVCGGSSYWRYNCAFGNTAGNGTFPVGTKGNISADPQFVRPASPGPDGAWGTADDDYGDLHLLPGSPCIDAGGNSDAAADVLDLDADGDAAEPWPFDLAGEWRFLDDPATTDTGAGTAPIVDMGAYEYHCGDANSDRHIDTDDLLLLGHSWAISNGQDGFDPRCDFNHDGRIDVSDLMLLTRGWDKPGDINGDRHVDAADLLILVCGWGRSQGDPAYNPRCDLNGDGIVDVLDMLILVAGWEP